MKDLNWEFVGCLVFVFAFWAVIVALLWYGT